MAVYGYCRVSTLNQSDNGESLGQQERAIRGYAMMHDFDEPTFFIERGVSGSVPLAERPEGSKLIAALEPGSIVICSKLDRMFRSALDALSALAMCKEKNISLHMIDLGGDVCGNGISKLVFSILSAVAEAERERIAERVRDVKRDQANRGRFLGGSIKFGHSIVEGALVANPEHEATIERMLALKAEGGTVRSIADQLTSEGVTISKATVARILKKRGGDRG